jgi:hypothetical protein
MMPIAPAMFGANILSPPRCSALRAGAAGPPAGSGVSPQEALDFNEIG